MTTSIYTTNVTGAGSAGGSTVTITGAGGSVLGATGTTMSWNGTSASTWNTTYGNTTYTVGAGAIGGAGTYTVSSPSISLNVEEGQPVLKTTKNTINLDELADMMKLMSSLLTAVVNDEEFAKRNPALVDAAHGMLIKKLKD